MTISLFYSSIPNVWTRVIIKLNITCSCNSIIVNKSVTIVGKSSIVLNIKNLTFLYRVLYRKIYILKNNKKFQLLCHYLRNIKNTFEVFKFSHTPSTNHHF